MLLAGACGCIVVVAGGGRGGTCVGIRFVGVVGGVGVGGTTVGGVGVHWRSFSRKVVIDGTSGHGTGVFIGGVVFWLEVSDGGGWGM